MIAFIHPYKYVACFPEIMAASVYMSGDCSEQNMTRHHEGEAAVAGVGVAVAAAEMAADADKRV